MSNNIVQEVTGIKHEPGKDIWLFGGAQLTTFFINEHLVDELLLAIHPIILGSGKPLFLGIKHRVKLTMVETLPYPSGLVQVRYTIRY